MLPSLDRYRKDLDALIGKGEKLHLSIQKECLPEEFSQMMQNEYGDKSDEMVSKLPPFSDVYQLWYSEAKVVVKRLLPERLDDFVRHYEKPKARKEITYENYRIEDYLQGLTVTRGMNKQKIVGPDAAIPQFRQQVAILKSVKARFESSLFDIRQLVQADLFDSELEAAKELKKYGFLRAAGAVAGVVLERHLLQVCDTHGAKVGKKAPGISVLNDGLKESNTIDVPQWRFVQHLGDLRNLCDHKKDADPTPDQVEDLIEGVAKVIKTLF